MENRRRERRETSGNKKVRRIKQLFHLLLLLLFLPGRGWSFLKFYDCVQSKHQYLRLSFEVSTAELDLFSDVGRRGQPLRQSLKIPTLGVLTSLECGQHLVTVLLVLAKAGKGQGSAKTRFSSCSPSCALSGSPVSVSLFLFLLLSVCPSRPDTMS